MKNKFVFIFSILTLSLFSTIIYFNLNQNNNKIKIKIEGSSLLNNYFNTISSSKLNKYSISKNETPISSSISKIIKDSGDIAIIDRDLTEKEKKLIKNKNIKIEHYATDHYAAVTNSTNNISKVTTEDIKKILSKKSVRWNEILSKYKDNKITTIFPNNNLEYLSNLKKTKLPILNFVKENYEKKEETKKISINDNKKNIEFKNSYSKIKNEIKSNVNSFSILPYSQVVYNENFSILNWDGEELTNKQILNKKYTKKFNINIMYRTKNKIKKFVKIIQTKSTKKNLFNPEKGLVFIP